MSQSHNDRETAKITEALGKLAQQPLEFRREISATAEEIGLDAATRTPVDTGVLKASKSVKHTNQESTVLFGGPAAHYATIVHNNRRAHHTTGEWGYLEKAVNEALPELEKRLRDIMDSVRQ